MEGFLYIYIYLENKNKISMMQKSSETHETLIIQVCYCDPTM